jgi:hypothetical protein
MKIKNILIVVSLVAVFLGFVKLSQHVGRFEKYQIMAIDNGLSPGIIWVSRTPDGKELFLRNCPKAEVGYKFGYRDKYYEITEVWVSWNIWDKQEETLAYAKEID